MRPSLEQLEPWATPSKVRGHPAPGVDEHFESVGAVVCHATLQVETVSQPWTGFEPYSQARPVGEQDVLDAGTSGGHRGAGPLSAQPPVHAPLLLPVPPLLLPWPPLLLVLPPPLLVLLPPPLPPLLPPLPPPLPPPLLVLLPAPLLLPPPLLLLPSLPVVNVAPPQASGTHTNGTISALPHNDGFITSETERSVCQSRRRESREFCAIDRRQKCAIRDTPIAGDIGRGSGSVDPDTSPPGGKRAGFGDGARIVIACLRMKRRQRRTVVAGSIQTGLTDQSCS
jgi:hypothetical protein